MTRILVTGGAGFIGSHLVDSLLVDGASVIVLDNFDRFYGRTVKQANLARHRASPDGALVDGDIRDVAVLRAIEGPIDVIVHLAALAGVRPSIVDPVGFADVNIKGTQNLLEFARERRVGQFVFASSSSVYGINPRLPWSEDDHVLQPISPYAATKVAGELLGHVYSRLYGIRFLALRFFTVYGPRQRPDLAIHKFARLMREGKSLPVFGDGSTRRDYTYVADVIQGVRAAMAYTRTAYEVINLGNNRTVSLKEMIAALEAALGRVARLDWLPEQPGDVPQTWADIEKARVLLGYAPRTTFADGIHLFADWMSASALQD